MSRGEAKRTLTTKSLMTKMHGTAWQAADATALLDEHPDSYKNIEQVMADQADLVRVDHWLHAIANYKGVEKGRR